MFDELKKIYSGKRVFLTGHTGFKGSWMLLMLSLLEAEVKGYALAPEGETNLYSVINGDLICHSVIADLRSNETLTKAILDFQPDFIFHLAAQPLVRQSYEIPSQTFEINVIGTSNLLDAVRRLAKPCHCVLITTDKVYHNNEWEYPYRENDRLGGYDPYSASKACAELVIDSYRNSFFNIKTIHTHQKGIAVGRAGNVIGGGDWAKDRLIPDIVKSLNNNENIEIRNPGALRPWQHVLEPLFGYLLLGAKLQRSPELFSQAYNFGPNLNDAIAVSDIVKLAVELWGGGDYKFVKRDYQPHEAGLLKLDISKAMSSLGWNPKLSVKQALEFTLNWYKQYYHYGKADIVSYTKNQILNFFYD